MKINLRRILNTLTFGLFILLCLTTANAQTTSFTYQGKLTDNTIPASGTYQMQFGLFDVESGGNQIGATQTIAAVVATSDGDFTVNLSFGAAAFDGADRYLQISVFSTATNEFVDLTPRRQITSSPYAIRSLTAGLADNSTNAASLGDIPANEFVQTNNLRLFDPRPPTGGSGNYIQNGAAQQPASNFNVSGNGTAGGTLSGGTVNAATHFNLGGSRFISATGGSSNTFVGISTGTLNSGSNNSFFGSSAGAVNTSGSSNSFFGRSAGISNSTGSFNSFYGSSAGFDNTLGRDNSFFGFAAGNNNTNGGSNSFFGKRAGVYNESGGANSFFGAEAGFNNSTANENSFFGKSAGYATTIGHSNSFFGSWAGISNIGGDYNSFFGRLAGQSNTTGNYNTFVGFEAGDTNKSGNKNTYIGYNARGNPHISNATAIGTNAIATITNEIVIGTNINHVRIPGDIYHDGKTFMHGLVDLLVLAPGGSSPLCLTGVSVLAHCSSSLRYKTNIAPFASGLNLVNRLRPITFDWKEGGMHDLGLGAEDVAAIEPLLVTYNKTGQVEGVKYDRIGVVLLNAVKEQQAQIQKQQEQIELLKQLVCANNNAAEFCRK